MKEKRNRKGKSMKKILLVAINAKYIHSNLAVYSLKAAAGKYGDQIEIAEYTINQQPDQILGDIYRRGCGGIFLLYLEWKTDRRADAGTSENTSTYRDLGRWP